MRRTPLVRRSPMRRSPWSKQPVKQEQEDQPAPAKPMTRAASPARAVMATFSGFTSAIRKTEAVRHEGYRRLVAALPCKACGVHGYSQAAHPNTGKGAGMKTDDRLCFPLCCDRPGVRGCHPKFDQGAMFTKDERREIEIVWAADTAKEIDALGLWPDDLQRPLA